MLSATNMAELIEKVYDVRQTIPHLVIMFAPKNMLCHLIYGGI